MAALCFSVHSPTMTMSTGVPSSLERMRDPLGRLTFYVRRLPLAFACQWARWPETMKSPRYLDGASSAFIRSTVSIGMPESIAEKAGRRALDRIWSMPCLLSTLIPVHCWCGAQHRTELMRLNFDVESLYGDQETSIHCPSCDRDFKVKLKSVMRDGSQIYCSHCQSAITVNHEPGSAEALARVNRSLKGIERSINRLGKK